MKFLRRMIVVIKAGSPAILVGAFWMERNGTGPYLRTEKDVGYSQGHQPIQVLSAQAQRRTWIK